MNSTEKITRQQKKVGALLATPALAVIGLIILIPLVFAFALSFTDFDLINPPSFVGLRNYRSLFTDPNFLKVIGNTFYFALGQVGIGIVVAFLLASLFNQRLYGNSVMRTIVYLPQAMSYVIVALLWTFLYDPFSGPVNLILHHLGIGQVAFLTDVDLAMPAIIAMSMWRNLGYFMIILLAGLKAIPQELVEAGQIDGAGAWRRLIHITIPQMKNPLLFVAVTWFMGSLQMFTQAYVMTQGGPDNSTRTIVYEMYESAFTNLDIGRACAVSTLLFGLVALIAIPIRLAGYIDQIRRRKHSTLPLVNNRPRRKGKAIHIEIQDECKPGSPNGIPT